MRFAFLVHPLSEESKAMMAWDDGGVLRRQSNVDMLSFCSQLHERIARSNEPVPENPRVRAVDEFQNLVGDTGARCQGRLYEIPMGAEEILLDQSRAMEYVEEATRMATEWGAQVVGLGSMTGVI